jgi:hypothetical protein
MANINLVIPDAQVPRVVNALCAGLKTPTGQDVVPTPALAKEVVIQMIKARVLMYEEELARRAIQATDVTDIVA